MVQFEDILERMKDVICHDSGGKVYDKNVAHVLEIDPGALAKLKHHNRIPYDAVTGFCIERSISVNWMLFGIGPKEMKDATKTS